MSPNNLGFLHFIGIGGIGMSGIAEMLATQNTRIQGSDLADSYNIKRLKEKGIAIAIGHRGENLKDAAGALPQAIVISSAVKPDNPELMAARAAKIPIVRRAEMLAELMRLKKGIAISGTHGKTTTTSMIGQMLESAALDPTVVNGGIVHAYGTNVRMGRGEWIVVEADESDGTFTRLPAQIVVVTNIDPEHLDHYGSFDRAKDAYRQFILGVPYYGCAIVCIDHPEVQALIPAVSDRRLITYGFSPQADIQALNIRSDAGGSMFDIKINGKVIKDAKLPMLGRHNVQNSLAAIAAAHDLGADEATIIKGLASFSGVKRRFTKTGEAGGVTIIDDYAHHPVEIQTVLSTARQALAGTQGRIIAVVQPHRFTRLRDLFDQFCSCFTEADTVIVADVYAAGETPIDGYNRDTLADGIRKRGHRDVRILETHDKLADMIENAAKPGDIVLCMGAGDITSWAYALPGEMK